MKEERNMKEGEGRHEIRRKTKEGNKKEVRRKMKEGR